MSDLAKRALKAAESHDARAIEAAIEALEDLLRERTGKPRELLGSAAIAAELGVNRATVQRSLSGEVPNNVAARIHVLTPKGPVPAISRADLAKWAPRSVGRPRKKLD